MPRQVRLEYEGAIYHLLSRGDRREDIFRDEVGGWTNCANHCTLILFGNKTFAATSH